MASPICWPMAMRSDSSSEVSRLVPACVENEAAHERALRGERNADDAFQPFGFNRLPKRSIGVVRHRP